MASSSLKDDKGVLPEHVNPTYSPTRDSHDIVNVQGGDLLDLESVDPVLNAKMKLVNDTIDEIGFTPYQAKLFVLNGFGYVTNVYFCGGGRCDSIHAGGSQRAVLLHLRYLQAAAIQLPCHLDIQLADMHCLTLMPRSIQHTDYFTATQSIL
jgi:hypothetical protein